MNERPELPALISQLEDLENLRIKIPELRHELKKEKVAAINLLLEIVKPQLKLLEYNLYTPSQGDSFSAIPLFYSTTDTETSLLLTKEGKIALYIRESNCVTFFEGSEYAVFEIFETKSIVEKISSIYDDLYDELEKLREQQDSLLAEIVHWRMFQQKIKPKILT